VRVVHLQTPPVRCLVPDGVFDAFGWCRSDRLEWRHPLGRWDAATPIDGSAPERMVFVFRRPCAFLPRELARLHAFGLGLGDEEALAPWAIDDATDGFHARGTSPGDFLWLAADNLNALFWGLHDWAHFHHHGAFERREQRAWTELQCDAAALAWLWCNRAAVALSDDAWERIRAAAEALSRERFKDEPAGGEDREPPPERNEPRPGPRPHDADVGTPAAPFDFEARALPLLAAASVRAMLG
jgi:hypothetical protein